MKRALIAASFGFAMLLGAMGAAPKVEKPVTYCDLVWIPQQQVRPIALNPTWVYELEGEESMRLIEQREGDADPDMAHDEYLKLPVVSRTMQTVNPKTDRWVDHGVSMTVFPGDGTSPRIVFSLSDKGAEGDQSDMGVAIPPRDGEWEW